MLFNHFTVHHLSFSVRKDGNNERLIRLELRVL